MFMEGRRTGGVPLSDWFTKPKSNNVTMRGDLSKPPSQATTSKEPTAQDLKRVADKIKKL